MTRISKRFSRSILAAGLALVLAGPLTVAAQAPSAAVDIPAGPMTEAIEALRRQTGIQVLYSADQLQNARTAGIRGNIEARAALEQLLEGSGFVLQADQSGALLITRKPAKAPTPARQRRDARASEQDAAVTNLPEMLVQGARSLNADAVRTIDDPQPYVVFDRRDIERSGAINLNDFLLKRVSANATAVARDQAGYLEGNRSSINLRGLGEGQTLILIDGRRAAPSYSGYSPGQQNLNGIPLAAVERVEVLPTTASAIYGGSATGGVINVILRRDYQGGEVSVSHDNSFDTDSAISRVDFSYGFTVGQRTSVLINGSYSESNLLLKRDRDFRARGLERIFATDPAFLTTTYHLSTSPNIVSQTGANLTLLDGTPLNAPVTFTPKGYLGPASDGGDALLANAGRLNTENDNNAFYNNGGSAFGVASRDKNLAAAFRHHITDRLDGFLDLSTSQTRSHQPVGALMRFSLAAGSPYNPFQQAIHVGVPSDEFNSMNRQRNESDRASMGLIARLGEQWAASLDFTWSRSTNFFYYGPAQINFNAAMADGFNPLVDYYNLGGRSLRPYLISDAGQLSGPSSVYSYNPTLRFSGPVWHFPAGPASVSLLLEQQRIEFAPRMEIGYAGSATEFNLRVPARSQDVKSAYAELKVPLYSEANRRRGLHALELQFAVRRDDYQSTAGNSVFWFPPAPEPTPLITENSATETTGLIGLKYAPMDGLTIRASHGTGFVPPDVVQLGAPTRNVFVDSALFDPRRGYTVNPTPFEYYSGGNPQLGPEQSKTTSFGFIVQPAQVPGLRASIDYTRLTKTDNIRTLPRALLLEYESQFPDRIRRGPNLPDDPAGWAGPITYLDGSYINAASARYETIDTQLKYGFDVGSQVYVEFWGNGTWTLHAEQQTVANGPSNNLRGISASYGASIPLNFRGFYGVNIERGPWLAGWTVRHYSSYLVADPELGSSGRIITAQGNGGRVPRQLLHDLALSWTPAAAGDDSGYRALLSRLAVSGGIRNVFNQQPEVDLSSDYAFYSYLVDPRLRTYYVQLKYAF